MRFNVPVSRAKEDGIFGAEDLPFCNVPGKTFEEEIHIIIDLPVMAPVRCHNRSKYCLHGITYMLIDWSRVAYREDSWCSRLGPMRRSRGPIL